MVNFGNRTLSFFTIVTYFLLTVNANENYGNYNLPFLYIITYFLIKIKRQVIFNKNVKFFLRPFTLDYCYLYLMKNHQILLGLNTDSFLILSSKCCLIYYCFPLQNWKGRNLDGGKQNLLTFLSNLLAMNTDSFLNILSKSC